MSKRVEENRILYNLPADTDDKRLKKGLNAATLAQFPQYFRQQQRASALRKIGRIWAERDEFIHPIVPDEDDENQVCFYLPFHSSTL